MQILACLIGIPGSGKTTFAQQVLGHGAWAWINQDTLGDREACRLAARRALFEGKNIIIDRSVSLLIPCNRVNAPIYIRYDIYDMKF